MNAVFCLAGLVIRELYRRKDFYVLFVLTAVITLLVGSANFFHEDRIVRYVKDLALWLIWCSSVVIAVVTAARQIPAEREHRTIFPLLAKPVSRGQFVTGKFLGCWLACGAALVVFYGFLAVVVGAREGHLPWAQLAQTMWMQWWMLGIIVGFALLGSVWFSAPSANATICFTAILAILALGGHLHRLATYQPAPLGQVLAGLYFLIPHLEWFYAVRERVVFDQAPLAWGDCLVAAGYAAAYAGLLVFATWLGFRRRRLHGG